MHQTDSLIHVVGGVAGAQHHWQARSREAAVLPAPAYTIAVAREAGAPGTAVAREVGRRLNWQVYDYELLQQIAKEHNLRVSLLETLDERRQSWLVECMEGFAQHARIGETGYVHHLTQTILSLGAHGCCVIVGRGAAHLLPPATTLRVRLVGAVEDRVAFVMHQRGMARQDAARWVETTERERTAFIKDHFRKDPADPRTYDLILNSSRWSVMECADLVVDALGRMTSRAAQQVAPTAGADAAE
jgi:cytidylate kinase